MSSSKPSLKDRTAKCDTCGEEVVPSNWDLPYFEYNGEGSYNGTNTCRWCGHLSDAHEDVGLRAELPEICDHFEPIDNMQDTYYCGCRGWDQ